MPDLLIENDGAVRILTMNRPEKRNALNMALSEALLDGLRDADNASDVRAIVLTGAGPAFCAGADLSEFAVLTPDNESLVERRATLTMELQGVCAKLSKPVVTAVNGAAMGGGAGLAIGGDIAVMSETAKIGYPGSQTRHRRRGGHGQSGASGRPQGSVRVGRHWRASRCGPRFCTRSGQSRRCAG